ncbi:hypothetical protein PoB_004303900 [Plakobranchus ocellatus]|uniref:Uncharacterized protein n=1 Tax=Plakobranchus ocellatus TaxID=259542 RepID=A0AAV4B8U4_9GAST|nr:hypothetical protein PoB_004303900 [Plakobranchus ocellatus]
MNNSTSTSGTSTPVLSISTISTNTTLSIRDINTSILYIRDINNSSLSIRDIETALSPSGTSTTALSPSGTSTTALSPTTRISKTSTTPSSICTLSSNSTFSPFLQPHQLAHHSGPP